MAVNKKKGTGIFGVINADMVLMNMAFVLFLVLLTVIYIANAHYSEKKVREIQIVKADLKKLKWEYMAVQSDVMYHSKQSDIVKSLKNKNIDLKRRNPKKILVNIK